MEETGDQSRHLRACDLVNLRLREIVGAQFVTGIVLYDGTHALPFGEGLWAVPLARL